MKELLDIMNQVWAMAIEHKIAEAPTVIVTELLTAYKHLNDAYEILNRDDE